MQRHVSLRPLSRDHHGGLVHARRLSRAADGGAAERRAAADAFDRAWRAEILEHFAEEERHLPPLLAGAAASEAAARLLGEHADLRARAEIVRASAEPEAMRALGERLTEHIRWEERELFPLLERSLTEAQLDALEIALARGEQPGRAGGGER